MSESQYCVVLFNSTSHAMHAEKICRKANIGIRLLPVPRQLSSSCGVCMRFFTPDKPKVEEELAANNAVYAEIVELDIC
ncbi:MAG: DUF3343 domain-containing protein [bacterium]